MTPHKSELPAGQRVFAEQRTDNAIDFAIVPGSAKALTTLKAQFASAGHQVHVGGNDDFIVSRWGMSKYCESVVALRRFALVLGIANVPD